MPDPQYASTDPNFGLDPKYASADPNFGLEAEQPKAAASGTSWLDLATEGVSGLVSGVISPVKLLKNIYEDSSAEMQKAVEAAKSGDLVGAVKAGAKSTPVGQSVRVLGQMAGAQWDQLLKGKKAYDEGRTSEALGHTMAGLLPVLGPMAGNAGEAIGSGDPRRAAHAVGELSSLAVPGAIGKVLPKSVSVGGRFKNTNPAEVAAVQYGESAGIPIDAATATGNRVVRGTQWLADQSIGGAIPGQRAIRAQTEGLSRVSGELANRAHSTPVSPETAGRSVQNALGEKIGTLHGTANKAYGDLAGIEAASAAPVQVGTKTRTLPVTGATITEPVMETMGLPLDLSATRSSLRLVYERLSREAKLVPLMGDKARALTALDRLMTGPKIVPASIADGALSELKSLSRFDGMPELRPEGKGAAAMAVRTLEEQVQRAVAQGGPEATTARNIGREATKQKYAVGDILDDLKTEPVKAYRQATAPGDQNVAYLRQLQRLAPKEMPKVGRAYLDGLFEKATAEGGFSRAQGLFADWQKLGPETKRTLFPDATHRANLDHFFLLAKKIGESPNPSGSGFAGSLTAQGMAVLMNPLAGFKFILGGAALSKLLHSKVGVKLLTETLTIPVAQRAKAAAATSRVAAIAGLTVRDRVPMGVPAFAGEDTSTPEN